MQDYIRIGCAVPPVELGNVAKNTDTICSYLADAAGKDCALVVFPELAMTGYTCADLFFQQSLRTAVSAGLGRILEAAAQYPHLTAVVGLPVQINNIMYNGAAVITGGTLAGIGLKTYLPNYDGAKERRWFASAADLPRDVISLRELGLEGEGTVPVGADLVFDLNGAKLGLEICEDLWAPVPPSTALCLGGAELIVNPAASCQLAGKTAQRQSLVREYSTKNLCAYAFCSAGATESTQDLVYSGHSLVYSCGEPLSESDPIQTDYLLICDVDLGQIRANRSRNTTFRDSAAFLRPETRTVETTAQLPLCDGSRYPVSQTPYMPAEPSARQNWCRDVFEIQVAGLMGRLRKLGCQAVVGVSGGLDSTLALLVAVEAMKRLGRPASCVHGLTMPCFGTSDRTANNAQKLMEALGITHKTIDIRQAVTTHFRDIGQPEDKLDATYENAQARERTQVLMDYAGRVGGIVIGTGDLSELALGWCTYNGDHMSMYAVNGSVPKTAIPGVIRAAAQLPHFAHTLPLLEDVIDTPISPELLPPAAGGQIAQQTEDIVGPYLLHDFFLYYIVAYGYTPAKIYAMACRAFRGTFAPATIQKWLKTFYRRFLTQQFKRNCQPDGIRTGAVSFSPRGDWSMPSDVCADLWLREAEEL